jgi:hypothetical protein
MSTGLYETTQLPSSALRHLVERKRGHSHQAPGKAVVVAQGSVLCRVLKDGKIGVTQAIGNKLAGFLIRSVPDLRQLGGLSKTTTHFLSS